MGIGLLGEGNGKKGKEREAERAARERRGGEGNGEGRGRGGCETYNRLDAAKTRNFAKFRLLRNSFREFSIIATRCDDASKARGKRNSAKQEQRQSRFPSRSFALSTRRLRVFDSFSGSGEREGDAKLITENFAFSTRRKREISNHNRNCDSKSTHDRL